MTAEHADPPVQDVVTTMQDALLPTGVVALPEVDVAARYLLAQDSHSAGGDWFDAVPLPGGRVALVVGDVVGGGVSAAAVMGQLRAVLVAGLLSEDDPAAALRTLDAFAEAVPEARGATVGLAILDPATPVLCYVTAGHPPPVLVRQDGSSSFLPTSGSGPLGCGTTFRMAEHPLEPGDLVLMCTDGLLERPGVPPEASRSQLLRVASEAVRYPGPDGGSAVERICDLTLTRLTRYTGVTDDATVIAGQRLREPANDFSLDLPALPDTVRVVRLELAGWLGMLRLSAIDQLALQQAVGELVSNVIEHAYPTGSLARDTSVRVHAALTDDGFVVVDVADDGTWRKPSGERPQRRHGLAIASGFVDHLEPVPAELGTRMRVRHRALRPVQLFSQGSRAGVPAVPDVLTIDIRDAGGLELSGAVDPLAVDRLAAELRSSAAGHSEQFEVDLSKVTVLCSAGVQLLVDAVATGRRPGRPRVVLHAAMGTLAQHVLDLVQLPYEPSGVGS